MIRFTIFLLFLSSFASANTNQTKLDTLAKDFYHNQMLQNVEDVLSPNKRTKHPCRPDVTSCVDSACDLLGPFDCDQREEVLLYANACRNNYDGNCIEVACDLLGPFACNEKEEVLDMIKACDYVYGGACLASICERLGAFKCNEPHEVVEVLNSCRRNR